MWQYMQEGAANEVAKRENPEPDAAHNYAKEAQDADVEGAYISKLKKTRESLQPRELQSAIKAAVKAVQDAEIANERHETNKEKNERVQNLRKMKEDAVTDASLKIKEAKAALQEAEERMEIAQDISAKAGELGIEQARANDDLQSAHLGLDFAKRALVQAGEHKKECQRVLPQFVKQADEAATKVENSGAQLRAIREQVVRLREAAGLTEDEMRKFLDPRLDDTEQVTHTHTRTV